VGAPGSWALRSAARPYPSDDPGAWAPAASVAFTSVFAVSDEIPRGQSPAHFFWFTNIKNQLQ